MTAVIPAAPADLCDVARAKWDELAPRLVDRCRDIPAELLADLLHQYAAAWAVRAAALVQLATGPLLVASPNGVRYPNPHFKIVEQAEKVLDRVFRRLDLDDGHAAPFQLDLD